MRIRLPDSSAALQLPRAVATLALLASCGNPAASPPPPAPPCTQEHWLAELGGPEAVDCGVLLPGQPDEEFAACVTRHLAHWEPVAARIDHDSMDFAGLPDSEGLVLAPDGVPWFLGSAIKLCDGAPCGIWLARSPCPDPYFIHATLGRPGVPAAPGRPERPATPGDPPGFGCAGGEGWTDYLCPLDGAP